MILDVVKEVSRHEQLKNYARSEIFKGEDLYLRWIEHPSSEITHHDDSCCEEARLWFLAFARSMEGWTSAQYQMRAPSWLSQHFTWGPSPWPISWCEIFKEKTIDCGVFAALGREIFAAQGVRSHPGQILLRYNEHCTDHWKSQWQSGIEENYKNRDGDFFPWVGKNIVYHEICVLELPNGEGRVFDSTFGHWISPIKRDGFGAVLSIRSECPRLLQWGNLSLSFGEWIDL